MENKNRKIHSYIQQNTLMIEEIMSDFSNYIYTIVRNSYISLSDEDIEEIVIDVIFTVWKSLSTRYTTELSSENNTIKQAILLENSNHTYPKSNNIYISFSTVTIFKNQQKKKTIIGNWNFDINVIDKFVNRETIKYIASRSEDVKIINAELTPTGLDIEMKFNTPQNAENIGKNIKIQDENGKEYFSVGGISVENELTAPTIRTSFSITTFNVQDNLKLIIKADREIIIDLNREK